MHISLLILDVLIHLWFPSVAALCPSGYFGANCDGFCHCLRGPEVCESEDGRCREGSCKPGWKNLPLCQTECPKGSFGLNCTQYCHCNNTAEECSAVNGHCVSNECAFLWTGPSCQIRMPVLSEPPAVRSINHSHVTLTWSAFEHTESSGNISISSYRVQMLNDTDNDWTDVGSVSASSNADEYSFTTSRLKTNQTYKFRITVIWLNSNKPQTSEPGPETEWIPIVCREPTGGPRSLQAKVLERRTDTIKITWQSPVDDSGCDRYGWLVMNLTCTPECEPISHKVDLPSSTTFMAVSQRNRSSSTIVTISVQAFNNAGLGSQKISPIRVRLFPNDRFESSYNSSGPADIEEMQKNTSNVNAVVNVNDSTVSGNVVNMSEIVTKASVASTNIVTIENTGNITERDHNETVFIPASEAVDDAFPETHSLPSYTGDPFGVISAPYSQSTPGHVQQKRYQLFKRSQHTMSFLETRSDQSSNDSTGALQVTVKEGESLYAVVSSGPPGITIDQNRSIVISNLKAGTLYQVDVSSHLFNSSDVVVLFSAAYWTLMQAPPKLSPPQLIDVSNTSITLKTNLPRLGKRSFTSLGIAYGLLVVVEPDMNDGSRLKSLTESEDVLVNDAVAIGSKDNPLHGYRNKGAAPYYVALEIWEPPKDGVVVVGDDRIYGKQGEYYNVPLTPGLRYWLWIGLTSSLDGVTQNALTPFEYPVRTVGWLPLNMRESSIDGRGGEGLSAGSVAAIILALILFVLIVSLFALWWYLKYKKRRPDMSTINAPTYRPSSDLADKGLDTVFAEESRVDETQIEKGKPQPSTFDASFYVMKSNQPIPVHRLRHHYETHLRPNSHYALQDEFRRLPDGFTDATNVANLAYNVTFNRSQAIVPYDKNRVKLARQFPNDNTYINASFIRTIGYRSCIVTQCPMASTANEFWRMVWEMKVGTIVMLLEPRDSNGPEYYKYWPSKSKPIYYHDVKVQLMREDRMAHHEVREFRVSCTSEKVEVRRVIQWQYVQWKPGGIPDHPIPFLNMIAAIQEEHDPESGFLIHCLKGGGRSGIYAAVDALVNEGKRSGRVDVLECVTLLRLERVSLVKSLKQYRFVYHCLIEAFNCHETRTPVHRFHFMLANLLARNALDSLTRFEKEYNAVQLECYAVRPHLLATSSGIRSSSVGTRFSSPGQKEMTISDQCRYGILPSDTINMPATVLLDGCFTKDAFVLSSPPEKGKIGEFWDMVSESNSSCIVMLNKTEEMPFAERFLPEDGSFINAGRYTVYCDSVLIHPNSSFYVHNLSIVLKNNSNNANAVNSIRLYEFAKWPDSLEMPLIDAVLDLTINVADWSQRAGGGRPVIMFSIHGGDKARAAIFAIIWLMIDPIQYDGVVDVYSAARYVYSYMPNAITSVEQYHFLYRLMEEHVIRIEKHKWRPEKVSDSYQPSVLLRTYKSDDDGEERLPSKTKCKPGKRRKLKRLSSDGSTFQSLKKKKRDSKSVIVDQNVSVADSPFDGDQDVTDAMKKSDIDAKCNSFSVSAPGEESSERWQSPDKNGKWLYPDLNALSKDASPTDETNCGMYFPKDTSKTGIKLETCSSQKLDKSESFELLRSCSSDRRVQGQPEVTISPPGTEKSSAPVDVQLRSARPDPRQSPLTSTSSDGPSPTSKKTPVTTLMKCKCKMASHSPCSPTRQLKCRCKIKQDLAPVHSRQTDNLEKQLRPCSAAAAVMTTVRPSSAEREKTRRDKLEVPNYSGSLKPKANFPCECLSDEQIHKLSDKSLAKAQKQRRGLSGRREIPGCHFMDASSSDEDFGAVDVPCMRQDKSSKTPELQHQEKLLKKSSPLKKHDQRRSPSRSGKYSQKLGEKGSRLASQNTKPSNEELPGICSRETEDRVSDKFESKSDRKCLKNSTRKSSPERSTATRSLSLEKKTPASCLSSQSDEMENISFSTEPKLKTSKKFAANEDDTDRRCRSPGKSSSQEDKFTKTTRRTDKSPKASSIQYATCSQIALESPTLEEKPERGGRPKPKTQSKISSSRDSSGVRRRRKRSTGPSREEDVSCRRSQLTPEKHVKMSPAAGTHRQKRSKSPGRSPFRGDKTQRSLTTDQRRSRRSPSQEAERSKRSRLSSRSSSRKRSSSKSPSVCEKPTERKNHEEVPCKHTALKHCTAGPLGKSVENENCDQKQLAKMPPPEVGITVPADVPCSKEADREVLNSPQILVTTPDRTGILAADKPPVKHETNQQAKYFPPSAPGTPSNVEPECEKQVTNVRYPKVARNTVRNRAEEMTADKDEERLQLDSLSDLSIDTKLTVERAQARMEQKYSQKQDLKPNPKPQTASKELQNAKEEFRVYGSRNPPQDTINPPEIDATVLPPKETAAPCGKRGAKTPEKDISFDDLLDGLFYTSSVASTKSLPSTDTRQSSQTGLRSVGSKEIDSILSPERNAGIHSALPKCDASPKCGTMMHSPPPSSSMGQGFHPSDSDIPYIDDTDSGSGHESHKK